MNNFSLFSKSCLILDRIAVDFRVNCSGFFAFAVLSCWFVFFISICVCLFFVHSSISCKQNRTGSKCIDPNTGLVYFKYDFGYEFGILFPGEGHKFMTKKWQNQPTQTMSFDRTAPYSLPGNRDLIIPVRHEHSTVVNTPPSSHKTEPSAVPKRYPTSPKVISINMDALHSNDTLNKSTYQSTTGGFSEPSFNNL